MIRRARHLFNRYLTHITRGSAPGLPLRSTAETDRPVGYIDRFDLSGQELRISGWTTSKIISAESTAGTAAATPSLHRADVAEAHDLPVRTGFCLRLPYRGGSVQIAYDHDDARHILHADPFDDRRLRRLRRRHLPRAIRDSLRALPDVVRLMTTNSEAARQNLRALIVPPSQNGPMRLDLGLNRARGWTPPQTAGRVAILIPVYNAPDEAAACIDRVLRHTDLPFDLILADDASPDPTVLPILKDALKRVGSRPDATATLLTTPKNLGFVRNVNRALAHPLCAGKPVILLNSDAMVPAQWASRLVAPLLAAPDVASVTPMSNAAEILSAPLMCKAQPLLPGAVDKIDAILRTRFAGLAPVDMPTGVGFCMALSPKYLAKVPRLDTVFGRGYGEEVDWCQRTRALGGRHVSASNLFVEHQESRSFGATEKAALNQRNHLVLRMRYPDYDARVQDFIAADPLVSARLAAGLAWAARSGTAMPDVLLAHSLGGGADLYLQARIAAQGCAIVLRVGGPARWRVELHHNASVTQADTDCFETVKALLTPLKSARLVYSCAVGDPEPVEIPARLTDLAQVLSGPVEVLMHDYFPISPSYTLLDSQGRYSGPPDSTHPDAAHRWVGSRGETVTLRDWQNAWGAFMARADVIRVFSQNSARICRAAMPGLADRITITPHRLPTDIPDLGQTPPGPPVLGVLGNIGAHKGAAVVAAMGPALKRAGLPPAVLLGQIDPRFDPGPHVRVHGAYSPADIPALVARYGITHWLIPSIWPETFSYTTHEALATGRPVMVFDLGAQADAAKHHPNGRLLPLTSADEAAGAIIDHLHHAEGLRHAG